MSPQQKYTLWALWLLASVLLGTWLSYTLLGAKDKSVLMPGPLSDGHYQLRNACVACHTDPLGGGEVLQEACIKCHGAQRIKPLDSHPQSKFKDPRNAEQLKRIDALHCVSCHSEHRPQITHKNGLSQPRDLCQHCHQDVASERPSHAGMDLNSCTNAGCHNFHDNQALYTNFLIKHLDEPATREHPRLPERQFSELFAQLEDYPLARYPVQTLSAADADRPHGHSIDTAVQNDWLASAHARAGVNCRACHRAIDDQPWTDHPEPKTCALCHRIEVQAFGQGRHGMRLAAGLEAMTPAEARLPMRAEAAGKKLDCNACHNTHRYDTVAAAAQACLVCHNDKHSLAWKTSAHAKRWQEEQNGQAPAGSGVSCAGCHMPRVETDINDWMSRIVVQHNQSAVHSPNSKMIRPVCLQCHGLAFSLDALADPTLINNNFNSAPSTHIPTMDLAQKEKERREKERGETDEDTDTSMFGF